MSKAGQTKHHSPKEIRVAKPHLKKPERQSINNTSRKLRPVRAAERREILQRLREGHLIRRIASEMGIPFGLVYQLTYSKSDTFVTGLIQRIRLYTENGEQAASIEIDDISFVLNPKRYQQFLPIISKAFKEHLELFISAQWDNENFHVLHVQLSEAS